MPKIQPYGQRTTRQGLIQSRRASARDMGSDFSAGAALTNQGAAAQSRFMTQAMGNLQDIAGQQMQRIEKETEDDYVSRKAAFDVEVKSALADYQQSVEDGEAVTLEGWNKKYQSMSDRFMAGTRNKFKGNAEAFLTSGQNYALQVGEKIHHQQLQNDKQEVSTMLMSTEMDFSNRIQNSAEEDPKGEAVYRDTRNGLEEFENKMYQEMTPSQKAAFDSYYPKMKFRLLEQANNQQDATKASYQIARYKEDVIKVVNLDAPVDYKLALLEQRVDGLKNVTEDKKQIFMQSNIDTIWRQELYNASSSADYTRLNNSDLSGVSPNVVAEIKRDTRVFGVRSIQNDYNTIIDKQKLGGKVESNDLMSLSIAAKNLGEVELAAKYESAAVDVKYHNENLSSTINFKHAQFIEIEESLKDTSKMSEVDEMLLLRQKKIMGNLIKIQEDAYRNGDGIEFITNSANATMDKFDVRNPDTYHVLDQRLAYATMIENKRDSSGKLFPKQKIFSTSTRNSFKDMMSLPPEERVNVFKGLSLATQDSKILMRIGKEIIPDSPVAAIGFSMAHEDPATAEALIRSIDYKATKTTGLDGTPYRDTITSKLPQGYGDAENVIKAVMSLASMTFTEENAATGEVVANMDSHVDAAMDLIIGDSISRNGSRSLSFIHNKVRVSPDDVNDLLDDFEVSDYADFYMQHKYPELNEGSDKYKALYAKEPWIPVMSTGGKHNLNKIIRNMGLRNAGDGEYGFSSGTTYIGNADGGPYKFYLKEYYGYSKGGN